MLSADELQDDVREVLVANQGDAGEVGAALDQIDCHLAVQCEFELG